MAHSVHYVFGGSPALIYMRIDGCYATSVVVRNISGTFTGPVTFLSKILLHQPFLNVIPSLSSEIVRHIARAQRLLRASCSRSVLSS